MKPTIFGKYLLLERLAVGGMAEVFVARASGAQGSGGTLAIKKILPTIAEDAEFIAMFIDEARISAQLNHPNIVDIHELGKHADAYYIAMEYVPCKDLRAILERSRRRQEIMPTALAVFAASRLCDGLDYAHRKKDARGQELNIIHRDVSPQNVLCGYEGEVKIIDFGIARAANQRHRTQTGILKGKFGYMSPEQVRGQPIDRRADVFAAGVILYEMLTSQTLFLGKSDFSTLEKVRNAVVPAPSQFNPNLPAGLELVVLKALSRDPDARYQWASELAADLRPFLVAGGEVCSERHLSTFMKSAFAEDLLRERERTARFAAIEPSWQLEAADITEPAVPPVTPWPSPSPRPARPPATPVPSPPSYRPTPSPRPARPAILDVQPPTTEKPAVDRVVPAGGGSAPALYVEGDSFEDDSDPPTEPHGYTFAAQLAAIAQNPSANPRSLEMGGLRRPVETGRATTSARRPRPLWTGHADLSQLWAERGRRPVRVSARRNAAAPRGGARPAVGLLQHGRRQDGLGDRPRR